MFGEISFFCFIANLISSKPWADKGIPQDKLDFIFAKFAKLKGSNIEHDFKNAKFSISLLF